MSGGHCNFICSSASATHPYVGYFVRVAGSAESRTPPTGVLFDCPSTRWCRPWCCSSPAAGPCTCFIDRAIMRKRQSLRFGVLACIVRRTPIGHFDTVFSSARYDAWGCIVCENMLAESKNDPGFVHPAAVVHVRAGCGVLDGGVGGADVGRVLVNVPAHLVHGVVGVGTDDAHRLACGGEGGEEGWRGRGEGGRRKGGRRKAEGGGCTVRCQADGTLPARDQCVVGTPPAPHRYTTNTAATACLRGRRRPRGVSY